VVGVFAALYVVAAVVLAALARCVGINGIGIGISDDGGSARGRVRAWLCVQSRPVAAMDG
jgi:hypothetical protein